MNCSAIWVLVKPGDTIIETTSGNTGFSIAMVSIIKGYDCILAEDGEQGWELLLTEVPDLIISDLMMPKKNGFEVCKTLKTDEKTKFWDLDET